MKNIFMRKTVHLFVGVILLLLSVASNAETSFVKYKDYLIPIDVREELEVVTQPATQILSTSASLNLLINSGEPNVTAWFEFSQSSQPTCAPVAPADASVLQAGQSDSEVQTGLTPASIYYFRACAIDDIGDVSSGGILSFRTANLATVVSTQDAKFVRQSSAVLNGTIDSGTSITTWFVYGVASNLQCGNPAASASVNGNTGDFRSISIGSLTLSTTYFYRFCGIGSDGVKGGQIKSFRTNEPTVVNTRNATSVFQTSAQLNGFIARGTNITTWFVHGLDGGVQCNVPSETSDSSGSAGVFRTSVIQSLSPNTTYYFRFCGLGEEGTKSGTVMSFTTPADPTSIAFDDFSGRTDSSITFTSTVNAGQNVKTWYVFQRSIVTTPLSCNGLRRGETTLQAGQSNSYIASNLEDWKSYNVLFCAEAVNGDIDSVARSFTTKRKSDKEYEVACNDSRMYSSQNGPLRFLVLAPDPVFPVDDHATFTIYNDGSNSLTYRYQSRTSPGLVSTTIQKSGKHGPIAIDPGFLNGGDDGFTSFYRLRIPGSRPWRAKVGCITENVFNKVLNKEQE